MLGRTFELASYDVSCRPPDPGYARRVGGASRRVLLITATRVYGWVTKRRQGDVVDAYSCAQCKPSSRRVDVQPCGRSTIRAVKARLEQFFGIRHGRLVGAPGAVRLPSSGAQAGRCVHSRRFLLRRDGIVALFVGVVSFGCSHHGSIHDGGTRRRIYRTRIRFESVSLTPSVTTGSGATGWSGATRWQGRLA